MYREENVYKEVCEQNIDSEIRDRGRRTWWLARIEYEERPMAQETSYRVKRMDKICKNLIKKD